MKLTLMTSKKFSFINRSRIKLSGVIDLPRGKNPVPTMIFCHGFLAHKNRLFARSMSRNLVRLGYAVVRYDLPGHGQSKGVKEDVTFSKSIADISQLINFLESENRLKKDSISLIGHSFGGILALLAPAYEPRISKVIAIGAALDLEAVVKNLLLVKKIIRKKDRFYYNFVPIIPKQECHQEFYNYSQNFSIAKVKSLIRIPLLFIHGEKDKAIPLSLGRILFILPHPSVVM